MKPSQFGLPPNYTKFRRRQPEAVWRLVESDKRFRCCVMPTGFGKTLVYMGAALLQGQRVCVLTSTKPHQDQLLRDFEKAGLVDVRGAANYPCILKTERDKDRKTERTCDVGHCRAGMECIYRNLGCLYFDAVRRAFGSQLVVTNYSYWMSTNAYAEGLGVFDTLVLDEAHLAPDELSDFIQVTIPETDILLYGLGYPPREGDWRVWARLGLLRMQAILGVESMVDDLVRVKRTITSLERLLVGNPEDWVFEHTSDALRWDIIWPHTYAESILFCGVKNVVLVSATIRKKTLSLLGVKKGDYDWIEYPSDFPVERRPVYFIPTAKVHRKMEPEDRRKIHRRIDEIVTKRSDRKGVIHSVSHDNKQSIVATSTHGVPVFTHERRELPNALARFVQAGRGVFVSPSVTTGFDFPYDACEYTIIPKIPFPDQSSKVVTVRTKGDRDYGIYLACQTLQQAVGRGMRAKDDRHETFILDDNFGWLYSRYKRYFARAFREAVQRRVTVPEAPPRVRRIDKASTIVIPSVPVNGRT